jgi:hypothetical protein
MAYEVTTTAGHSGPIQLCFTVPGINDAAIFNSLQVLHGENGVLVDRTVWRDFATRIICAQVSSLSPFTIAMKVDTNLPIVTGLVVGEAGHPIPDVTLELGPANSRQTITSIAGQFAFANLQSGSNYTILPLDDRFDFTPPLVVIENATGTNLIAFIAVPKPIPSLTILPDLPVSGYITLMWPADSRSYVLESTDSLSTPGWTMRPETPALEDDTFKVSLAVSGERRFFRLRSQ